MKASLAGHFGMLVAGYVIWVMASRVLGPGEIGMVVLALASVISITRIAGLSLGATNKTVAGRYPEVRGALFGNSMVIAVIWGGIVSIVCLIALSRTVHTYFRDFDPTLWGMVLVGIVPLLVLEFMQGIVLERVSVRHYFTPLLGREVFFLLAIVSLMLNGEASVYSVMGIWLILAVLTACALVFQASSTDQSSRVDFSLMQQIIKFTIRRIDKEVFSTLNLCVGPILIALFMRSEDVGHYAVAMVFVTLVNGVPFVFGNHISTISNMSPALTRVGFFLIVLAAGLVGLFGHWLVLGFVGREFMPSIRPLMLLLPGGVIYGMTRIVGNSVYAKSRSTGDTLILVVALILNVVLAIVLITGFGIAGVAAATSIAQSLAGLILLHNILRDNELTVAEMIIPRSDDLKEISSGLKN